MTIPAGAIEPNSTEYGDRQTLEAGLAGLGGGGAAAGAPAGGPAMPPTTMPDSGNPLSSLLSGEVAPISSDPLTSGMSVGPGAGGAPTPGPTDTDIGMKLKMLAEQSTSPMLRNLAIMKLRAMQRGIENG